MCDKALPHPNPLPGGEGVKLPGAWYDLYARIREAQAVASCVLEAMPRPTAAQFEQANHASHLAAAVQDLLKLAQADADLIEAQFRA